MNIRGTGCSGGAFNFFENLQSLDGYDAIETVAAQPWSTGRVGMVGISYAGISQLFVARSQPPHLAAITPVSVIDDTWRGTLYPGGIFNDGFALSWATERVEQNKWPNPNAPGWVKQRINNGDTACLRNMDLRGQNVDQLGEIERHPYFSSLDPKYTYDFPGGATSLAPAEFVNRIKAPVLIAGAWQDEQTGGHWANLLDKFSPSTRVRAVGQNGVHIEQLDPSVLAETLDFLQIYVAQRTPVTPAGVQLLAPAILGAITGVGGLQMPPDRFPVGTTFAAAKAAFEADPPVRILWETGNASSALPGSIPGAPIPRAETRYASWPIPGTTPTTWYLKAGARLGPRRPTPARGADSYSPNPDARPRGSLPSGNVWAADAAVPVDAGRRRRVALVPLRSAALDRDDGGHRKRRPLDLVERRRRRRAGDLERGASRRHRALHPERLAAPQPPQAGPDAHDPAEPVPLGPRGRRRTASAERGRAGQSCAVPVRTPVPGGHADPTDGAGPRRRPARVDLRAAEPLRPGDQPGVSDRRPRIQARPAGPSDRPGPRQQPRAVPVAAGATVPAVPGPMTADPYRAARRP